VILLAVCLPCGDFLDQRLLVGDAPIEHWRDRTLSSASAMLALAKARVQPTAVLGRVMPFEPLDETACLGGREGFME
jgi:hypothetical protein